MIAWLNSLGWFAIPFVMVPLLAVSALVFAVVNYWQKGTILRRYVFSVFVAAAVFFMRLPRNTIVWNAWETLLASIGDTVRYFVLEASFEPLSEGLSGASLTLYNAVDALLFVLAPVCTATLLLRLIREQLRRVWMSVCVKRPIYYFSELNDKSLTLAQSILKAWEAAKKEKKKEKKPCFVFCKDGNGSDGSLRMQARQLGAVFYKAPIYSVPLELGVWRDVSIFFIDLQEEENALSMLTMKDKLPDPPKGRKRKLYVSSTLATAEPMVDAAVAKLKWELQLVHETRMIAEDLLLEEPLYKHMGSEGVSMLIVGGGSLGMEVLKAAMVCGVMLDASFSVTVMDQNAATLRDTFFANSSYTDSGRGEKLAKLWSRQKPRFLKVDANGRGLEKNLLEKYTYIVVSMGDDEQSCETARRIMRHYRRRGWAKPAVFAAIRDPAHSMAMKFLEDESITLFGCNTDIFHYTRLVDRPLDRAAARLKAAYDKDDSDPQTQLVKLHESPQVIQYSNRLAALHSSYKMHLLGDPVSEDELNSRVGQRRAEYLELEHMRWCMFHILSGWTEYPLEQMRCEPEEPSQKRHRDALGKRHGCLIDSQHLPELEAALEALGCKEDDFDDNDYIVWQEALAMYRTLFPSET